MTQSQLPTLGPKLISLAPYNSALTYHTPNGCLEGSTFFENPCHRKRGPGERKHTVKSLIKLDIYAHLKCSSDVGLQDV